MKEQSSQKLLNRTHLAFPWGDKRLRLSGERGRGCVPGKNILFLSCKNVETFYLNMYDWGLWMWTSSMEKSSICTCGVLWASPRAAACQPVIVIQKTLSKTKYGCIWHMYNTFDDFGIYLFVPNTLQHIAKFWKQKKMTENDFGSLGVSWKRIWIKTSFLRLKETYKNLCQKKGRGFMVFSIYSIKYKSTFVLGLWVYSI